MLDFMPKQLLKKLKELQKEQYELEDSFEVLTHNYKYFMDDIQDRVFQKVEAEIVIYDEVEKFRSYDHPSFNYPYGERKTKLSGYTLNP